MVDEDWSCGDCGYTETAPFDELAGERVERTVGEGHRRHTIETAVCPDCGSDDWHSESVRDAFGGTTNGELGRDGSE